MELGSFFLHGGSSQHQGEFEFQMSTSPLQREVATSPADELFYKGKLLPLQLPPRIETVKKLLRGSVSAYEGFYGSPLITTAPISTAGSTPVKSCNVSLCESGRISRELNPDVYFRKFLVDTVKPMGNNPKKSWSGNIKLIKRLLFGPKLKGSRAFFKSLPRKSGCLEDSSAAATKGFAVASSSKRDKFQNRKGNQQKRDGSPQATKERAVGDDFSFRQHRRPLSLSSKWLMSNKISSSSFASSSSSSLSGSASKYRDHDGESESRNSSRLPYVNAESPIHEAIAYCKQSQNLQQESRVQRDICWG